MKHTSNFLGPTKNSKRIFGENLLTPQHQIEAHQGIFQNQRAFYFPLLLGKKHSRRLKLGSTLPNDDHYNTYLPCCTNHYFDKHVANMWFLVLSKTSTKKHQGPNRKKQFTQQSERYGEFDMTPF